MSQIQPRKTDMTGWKKQLIEGVSVYRLLKMMMFYCQFTAG